MAESIRKLRPNHQQQPTPKVVHQNLALKRPWNRSNPINRDLGPRGQIGNWHEVQDPIQRQTQAR